MDKYKKNPIEPINLMISYIKNPAEEYINIKTANKAASNNYKVSGVEGIINNIANYGHKIKIKYSNSAETKEYFTEDMKKAIDNIANLHNGRIAFMDILSSFDKYNRFVLGDCKDNEKPRGR